MIAQFFEYFQFFSKGRRRIYSFMILLGIIASAFEAIGITMFLPILASNTDASATNSYSEITRVFLSVAAYLGLGHGLNAALNMMVLLFIAKGVFKFFEVYVRSFVSSSFIYQLRSRLMITYSQMSFSFFSSRQKGVWSSFLVSEPSFILAAFLRFSAALSSTITMLTLILISLSINWSVTLLAIVVGAGVGLALRNLARSTQSYSRQGSESIKALNDFLIQTLNAFKYFKATRLFSRVVEKTNEISANLSETDRKVNVALAVPLAISQPVTVLVLALILFWSVNVQGYKIASVVVTLGFVYRIFSSLMAVVNEWHSFSSFKGYIDSVNEHLSTIEKNLESDGLKRSIPFLKDITFDAVGVSSGGHQLLQGISFQVKKNTIVGVLGRSGSGKTTLFDLLLGILTPSHGQILVDGMKLDEATIANWRQRVGVVVQDVPMFNDTIFNNITLWERTEDPEAQEKAVIEALRKVKALSFIEKLPNGLNSRIGERGVQVSGGQRQRIALARELYKKPEILILDEATAALDSETEGQVLEELVQLKKEMTILMISHRMSAFRICDQLLAIDNGRVVADGTYDDMAQDQNSLLAQLSHGYKVRSRVTAARVRIEPEARISLSLWRNGSLTPVILRDVSTTGIGVRLEREISLNCEIGGVIRGVLYLANDSFDVELCLAHRGEDKMGFSFVSLASKTRDTINNFIKYG